MKTGYINQKQFIKLEKSSFINFPTYAIPFNHKTFSGKQVSFHYYEVNFSHTNAENFVDIYFLPYGVDLSGKHHNAFSMIYQNFFAYYKRPTIIITFVDIKFKKDSHIDPFNTLADELKSFLKEKLLEPKKILGASMGARAALVAALYFLPSAKEVYLYELPGLNQSSVLIDFYKTLFLDKHYNLNLAEGVPKGSRALHRSKNYAGIVKRFLSNISSESKLLQAVNSRNFLDQIKKLSKNGVQVHMIIGEDSHLTKQALHTLEPLHKIDQLNLVIVSELGHYIGENITAINKLTELICTRDITKHSAYHTVEF